jgi:hypothetical protein
LHYKALFYAFGADDKGSLKLPDRTNEFIETLERKGFILDYEYKIKLLQIEKPENSINLALCLKPVFSSMPVAYFIEFFDKTNKPELTGARAVGTAQCSLTKKNNILPQSNASTDKR